jgi:hypothetical protein
LRELPLVAFREAVDVARSKAGVDAELNYLLEERHKTCSVRLRFRTDADERALYSISGRVASRGPFF